MPGNRRSVSIGAGNAPTPRTNSPTYSLNTRRTTRAPTMQGTIEATPNIVKDIESRKEFLRSKLLCHVDQPFTLTHLISVLFQITQMSSSTPAPVISATRAVAFILKEHIACDIAEKAAKQISESLSARLVEHVVAAISPQVALVHSASQAIADSLEETKTLYNLIGRERAEKEDGIKTAADRIEEAADSLYSSLELCQNDLKTLTPSLDAAHDKINSLYTKISNPPTQQTVPSQPLYSNIAANHLPPTVDQVLGRAAIKARQVLLDPTPGETLFPPNSSNYTIAGKLKEALIKARNDTTPPGSIRAVTTLRNGGIVIELETEALANWFKSPEGKAALENNLEKPVSFRQRYYPLVLEFLPIHLQIEREDFLRSIEQEDHLPPSSIASIRWIKPLTRRTAEQRKAFALLQIVDVQTANSILREGICIANERITIRKDKKEPIRCAKCQKYNHIAKNCHATTDTCGICADSHRTSDCNSYRTTKCINCRSQQHDSRSRQCPEFIKRCKDIDEKYPENRMPFFPTDHAWTQVVQHTNPSRMSASPSPPSSSQRQHTGGIRQTRQTTLTFLNQQPQDDAPIPHSQEPLNHPYITGTEDSFRDSVPIDSTPPSSPINV